MRVLYIVGTFPALSEPFIINQIAGTVQRGHEVLVYAAYGAGQVHLVDHPLVESNHLMDKTVAAAALPKGVFPRLGSGIGLALRGLTLDPLKTLKLLNVPRYGWQAASLQLLHQGAPLLEQQPFDIIHCQFGTLGLIGLTLRREGLLRGALITTFRGHDISTVLKTHGGDLYAELFHEGDYFLANCEYFRNKLVSLGCDHQRLEVLFSGIDVQRFRYRGSRVSSDGKLRIASVGRLVEKKGLHYAIDAAAMLRDAAVPFELTIGGDGPMRATLQQKIDAFQLQDSVKMLGALRQVQVIELLEQSDILLAPSVTARDGDEDAPVNTLKEAMAIGLPVVSTFHGGIPELVEDGINGYLVPERDAAALAERLTHLARHPELWATLGQQGRLRVEAAFDSPRLDNRLCTIYDKVRGLCARPRTWSTPYGSLR
jgi:colanic acid/amylovoran biosynthesis glycosyltransferase